MSECERPHDQPRRDGWQRRVVSIDGELTAIALDPNALAATGESPAIVLGVIEERAL